MSEVKERFVHIMALRASVTFEEPFELPEWQIRGYRRSLERMLEKLLPGKVVVDLLYKERRQN